MFRPAFKELDLPDIEAFRASASDEALSALREFTLRHAFTLVADMISVVAAEKDESFEYALTIARLECELTEIQQSVIPLFLSIYPLIRYADEKLWSLSSRRIATVSSRRRRRSRRSSMLSTCT